MNLIPKQMAFVADDSTELLVTGGAGCGKTTALLHAALRFVDRADYRALILARSHRQQVVTGGIIPMSQEILGGKAKWNEQFRRWTFASGAIVEFGHCGGKGDGHFRFAGGQWQGVFIDSANQFRGQKINDEDNEFVKPPKMYDFLKCRLRRPPDSDVPLRMRVAASPGLEGDAWIKARFVGEDAPCKSIAMGLADNPGIDPVAFKRQLAHLDQKWLKAMAYREWS